MTPVSLHEAKKTLTVRACNIMDYGPFNAANMKLGDITNGISTDHDKINHIYYS